MQGLEERRSLTRATAQPHPSQQQLLVPPVGDETELGRDGVAEQQDALDGAGGADVSEQAEAVSSYERLVEVEDHQRLPAAHGRLAKTRRHVSERLDRSSSDRSARGTASLSGAAPEQRRSTAAANDDESSESNA